MGTRVGTRASAHHVAKSAVAEAVQAARASLDGAKVSFGFLFASPSFALAEALAAAREMTGADIIGCSSAGEITERGLVHGGMAIMLVASDAAVDVRFATGLKMHPERVARELSATCPR